MEVETPVDYEATKRILELLGFRIKETYSKIREEYRLDGCAVCLDHIPQLARLVCAESKAARRRSLRAIAKRAGLQPADREHRSYRRLIRDAALASAATASGEKGRLAA